MSINKHTLLMGGHVSIAGGFQTALDQAKLIQINAIQIFTKSNRQWQAKAITSEEATAFKKAFVAAELRSIVAHATYLINLASADTAIAHRAQKALIDELYRCSQLNIPYLVLHPGAYGSGTREEGIVRLARNLSEVMADAPGTTMVLIENMAGQGSSLARTFEELGEIYDKIQHKKRIGVAFDTCHAFAAGYEFSMPDSYETMWEHFDKTVGLSLLKVIHVNDSIKEKNSHVDRHAHIGKGKIGVEAFKLLFNDPRFFDVPKILETPWEIITDYLPDIALIKELLTPKTRELLRE